MTMFEEDKEVILAMTASKRVDEDITIEYDMRMRMATVGGHSGSMGVWAVVDMLRYLGRKPPVRRAAREMVRWSKVRVGVPVVVNSPEYTDLVGWFQGDLGEGILSVRSPDRVHPVEVYAKFVRLADDTDDTSSLQEVPANLGKFAHEDELDGDEPDDFYADDEPKPARKTRRDRGPTTQLDEDEDDGDAADEGNDYNWTAGDIGRAVLVEDGEAEFTGTLVGIGADGQKVSVEIDGEDGTYTEEYSVKNVYSNEPSPVMILAAQQMAEEQAAKKEIELTGLTI